MELLVRQSWRRHFVIGSTFFRHPLARLSRFALGRLALADLLNTFSPPSFFLPFSFFSLFSFFSGGDGELKKLKKCPYQLTFTLFAPQEKILGI